MTYDEAVEFTRANHRGVLSTLKRDSRPQLSNISYMLDEDNTIKISVTQDRAKTRNARRDPRVSMVVIGDNWYKYVVAEGRAEILEHDPVPELRRVYEAIAGKPHPNWRDFDEAMVRDKRAVMRIHIERFYPLDGGV